MSPLHRGLSICYETRFRGRPFIQSWGRLESVGTSGAAEPTSEPTLTLRFWQRVFPIDRISAREERLLASLECTADMRPIRYHAASTHSPSLEIVFEPTRFLAKFDQGPEVLGDWENADFLLGSNMVAQLALTLLPYRSHNRVCSIRGFFSPDVLAVIPYQLAADNNGLVSSFGEHITFGADGLIERIILPAEDFQVSRRKLPVPRWGDPRLARQRRLSLLHYQPPGPRIVEIEEIRRTWKNYEIIASVARPPAGTRAVAAAFFLGGSGVYDRHGIAEGIDLGYHDLLDRLATLGILSLRFELKRSREPEDGPLEASFHELIDAAEAALREMEGIKGDPLLPRFLIGHSQGSLVALVLAQRSQSVTGVILLATAAGTIDEVLREQLNRLAADLGVSESTRQAWLQNQAGFFEAVKSVADWTEPTVGTKIYAERHRRRWFQELVAFDPLELVARSPCPLLILQGGRDLQVNPSDAGRLRDAAVSSGVDAQLVLFPDLDHLLKRATAQSGFAAYSDRRRTVSRAVVQSIAGWIRIHSRAD